MEFLTLQMQSELDYASRDTMCDFKEPSKWMKFEFKEMNETCMSLETVKG